MHKTLKFVFYAAMAVFVVFELTLNFYGPDCMSFDCLVFNLSDVRMPILRTEAPPTTQIEPVVTMPVTEKQKDIEPGLDLETLSGEERARLARSRCKEVYGDQPKPVNLQYPFENRVFLTNQEKMAYCAVAKAYSSNIKRVMMVLSRPNRNMEKLKRDMSPITKIVYPHQLNFWTNSTVLKDLSKSGQTQVLKDYYKFVIVRDPILKAISAYRDKFFSQTDDKFHKFFRQATGRAMCLAMDKYRQREDANKFLKSGTVDCNIQPNYMDLQAFLAWTFLVPDQFKPHDRDNLNPHWAPSIPICRICGPTVNYDFIGHFEKGLRDVYAIFDRANWHFPFPNVSDTSITEEETVRFRREVDLLPEGLMVELNRAVAVERYILGYTNEKPQIIRGKLRGN